MNCGKFYISDLGLNLSILDIKLYIYISSFDKCFSFQKTLSEHFNIKNTSNISKSIGNLKKNKLIIVGKRHTNMKANEYSTILRKEAYGLVPLDIFNHKVSLNDLKVYIYLQSQVKFSTVPKVQSIKKYTYISEQCIYRSLRNLRKFGLIK